MIDYKNMSDLQINKLVAMHLGKSVSAENEHLNSDACILVTDLAHEYIDFDPCNNPNDAWSIILENDIELNIYRVNGLKSGEYVAGGMFYRGVEISFNDITVYDKNPLRAAMICFLNICDIKNS